MIKCAVIPIAGLGKRMLPLTKYIPKEMFPVFCQSDTSTVLKPILQMILEQMVMFGIDDICLIVNNQKASIIEYFKHENWTHTTPLGGKQLGFDIPEVKHLLSLLDTLRITYRYQNEPRGFGDAVLHSMDHVREFPFLVQAGDELLLSPSPLLKLESALSKHSAEAGFLVGHSPSPCDYGVVEGTPIDNDTILVNHIDEKPAYPKSNTVVIAFYLFNESIFHALQELRNDTPVELTTAINLLIDDGHKVVGVKMNNPDLRAETGNVKEYYRTLQRILSLEGSG